MTTAYDVPADYLITKVAEKFKENEHINPPEWALHAKTGVHKELPPVDADWWYTRCAAVLRTVYKEGPVGVERLRSVYGGNKNMGVSPSRKVKGSGSIARKILQQLESGGYVRKFKSGRVLAPAGQSFMDNTAHEIKNELIENIPGLAKY